MSLFYPPLDLNSTNSVFELNLGIIKNRFSSKQRQIIINHFEIGGFVSDHWRRYPNARWNGRQIRNACQTALALAEFEAQGGNHEAVLEPNAVVELNVKHFQKVADAYLGFMQYMTDIYGVDEAERAKERFLRATPNPENKLNPLLTRKDRSSAHSHGSRNEQSWMGSRQNRTPTMQHGAAEFNAPYRDAGGLDQQYSGFTPQDPGLRTFHPGQVPIGDGQFLSQSWQHAGTPHTSSHVSQNYAGTASYPAHPPQSRFGTDNLPSQGLPAFGTSGLSFATERSPADRHGIGLDGAAIVNPPGILDAHTEQGLQMGQGNEGNSRKT